MSGYILHPQAYADLDEIWEFIAEDSLDAADHVREEIYQAIPALVPFPHQGHRRTDLTSRALRFRRVRDYLIAYAPDEVPVAGRRRHARKPQSPRDGRDSQGEGIRSLGKYEIVEHCATITCMSRLAQSAQLCDSVNSQAANPAPRR